MLETTRGFNAAADSVAFARRFAREALAQWGLQDLEWAVVQLVSELATNAVLHARTDYQITLCVDQGKARVAVRDGSARRVQPRPYGADATTGRGLALLQQMGSEWGVDTHQDGKTVWVQVDAETQQLADADSETLLAQFDDADEPKPSASNGSFLTEFRASWQPIGRPLRFTPA